MCGDIFIAGCKKKRGGLLSTISSLTIPFFFNFFFLFLFSFFPHLFGLGPKRANPPSSSSIFVQLKSTLLNKVDLPLPHIKLASHAEGYFFFSSSSTRRRTLWCAFSQPEVRAIDIPTKTDKTLRPPPYWVLLRSLCVESARIRILYRQRKSGWVGGFKSQNLTAASMIGRLCRPKGRLSNFSPPTFFLLSFICFFFCFSFFSPFLYAFV